MAKKAVKKSAAKKGNTNRMVLISTRAKEIRVKKPKMAWTDAIAAASKELKKEGKL